MITLFDLCGTYSIKNFTLYTRIDKKLIKVKNKQNLSSLMKVFALPYHTRLILLAKRIVPMYASLQVVLNIIWIEMIWIFSKIEKAPDWYGSFFDGATVHKTPYGTEINNSVTRVFKKLYFLSFIKKIYCNPPAEINLPQFLKFFFICDITFFLTFSLWRIIPTTQLLSAFTKPPPPSPGHFWAI